MKDISRAVRRPLIVAMAAALFGLLAFGGSALAASKAHEHHGHDSHGSNGLSITSVPSGSVVSPSDTNHRCKPGHEGQARNRPERRDAALAQADVEP